jgi:hypothetical protein
VVTYTGKVLYSTAPDKNNRVFLKVVTYTGDVSSNFKTVGKSYSGDLSLCRVRLLRGLDSNLGANASLLRCSLLHDNVLKGVGGSLQSRRLRLPNLVLAAFSYQLVKCRHNRPPFTKIRNY